MMRHRQKCSAPTQSGEPCKSFAISSRGLCVSHDPEYQARKQEGSRRGGEAKANARRAAKQWAAVGEQLAVTDLPAVLRSCMFSVKAGTMGPAEASAIASLAKASVQLAESIEMEGRIAALEQSVGVNRPISNIRRIS